MYYPYFLTYMLIGFFLSVVVFLWALDSGQFKDQQRARFLPLGNMQDGEPRTASKMHRIEWYALLVLACLGLLATAATLVFSLMTAG